MRTWPTQIVGCDFYRGSRSRLVHLGAALDDGLGRRIAGLSNLVFTGTLGVLVKAKQTGLLPAVAPVIEMRMFRAMK
jgi:uncharacterized protein DUF3368